MILDRAGTKATAPLAKENLSDQRHITMNVVIL